MSSILAISLLLSTTNNFPWVAAILAVFRRSTLLRSFRLWLFLCTLFGLSPIFSLLLSTLFSTSTFSPLLAAVIWGAWIWLTSSIIVRRIVGIWAGRIITIIVRVEWIAFATLIFAFFIALTLSFSWLTFRFFYISFFIFNLCHIHLYFSLSYSLVVMEAVSWFRFRW